MNGNLNEKENPDQSSESLADTTLCEENDENDENDVEDEHVTEPPLAAGILVK